MSTISKPLLLLALFVGLCSLFTSCSSPKTPELTRDDPLRSTLSVLETTTARQNIISTPAANDSALPLTGGAEPSNINDASTSVATPTPPLMEESSSVLPEPELVVPQLSPTFTCEKDDSKLILSASKTTLKVGETVEVKVVLKNTGCVALGLPQYRLAILNSEGEPIFSPDKPEPVIHSLAVAPGKSDEVAFILQAASAGKATLSSMASFEVHLGYPGPAYWGANSSDQLMIVIEK